MRGKNTKTRHSYFQDIFDVVRLTPHGRVTTYGSVANYLGTVTPRMVGWAMNKSFREDPPVPAHRVVNRKGELSGRNFFSSPTMMQEMLESEGITIEQNQIRDFKEVLWDPSIELKEE